MKKFSPLKGGAALRRKMKLTAVTKNDTRWSCSPKMVSVWSKFNLIWLLTSRITSTCFFHRANLRVSKTYSVFWKTFIPFIGAPKKECGYAECEGSGEPLSLFGASINGVLSMQIFQSTLQWNTIWVPTRTSRTLRTLKTQLLKAWTVQNWAPRRWIQKLNYDRNTRLRCLNEMKTSQICRLPNSHFIGTTITKRWSMTCMIFRIFSQLRALLRDSSAVQTMFIVTTERKWTRFTWKKHCFWDTIKTFEIWNLFMM